MTIDEKTIKMLKERIMKRIMKQVDEINKMVEERRAKEADEAIKGLKVALEIHTAILDYIRAIIQLAEL